LQVTLTNNGDSISLTKDDTSIVFNIPKFVDWSIEDIKDVPAEWKIGDQPGDNAPAQNYFTIRSTTTGTWPNGSQLSFKLENVNSVSGSDPTTGNFTADSDDVLDGDTLSVPLILDIEETVAPPSPVNLEGVLGVTLNNGGTIFVNDPPLYNQLTLNFLNLDKDRPIFQGTKWPTSANPQVYISFIWGASGGALTTLDTLKTKMISVDREDTSSDWEPGSSYVNNVPLWTLSPQKDPDETGEDSDILGIGDKANATFQFSDIAPIINGATQMYVQVTGFPFDDDNLYNNFTFTVPINKTYPPVRGIPYFHAAEASLMATPGQPLFANLYWQVFDIPQVQLKATALDLLWESEEYSEVLVTDNHMVDLSQFYGATSIIFNLYALDGDGTRINGIAEQTIVEIVYPQITVEKFTVVKNHVSPSNPKIKLEIYPLQMISDSDGNPNVTLTFKGVSQLVPNTGNDLDRFIYEGDYDDLFTDILEVNNDYQFQLNINPTFGSFFPETSTYSFVSEIGDLMYGGVVFWVDTTDDKHGLVCAKRDQSTGIHWWNGSYKNTGATSTSIGTGKSNTDKIIAKQGSVETNYAAGLARACRGGQFEDWFLPSKNELNQMHRNKVVINKTLDAIGGTSLPGHGNYWSSTEYFDTLAWLQSFYNGGKYNFDKVDTALVRAVRAF